MNGFTVEKRKYFESKGLAESDLRIKGVAEYGPAEMVREFFDNPKARYSGEEIFDRILANLDQLPPDSIYIGGFITLLSYRLIEHFNERSFMLKHMLRMKGEYDGCESIQSQVHARWLVSSTNALGSVLLMKGRKPEAKEVFLRGLQKHPFMPHTPLAWWNWSMLQFQFAMIMLDDGGEREAVHHFENCFMTCRSGIGEILHPRNEWFSRMILDCQNMIKLANHSVIARAAILGDRVPEGTRFAKFAISANHRFNGVLPLERFAHQDGDLAWHRSVQANVNGRLRQRFNPH